MTKMEKTKIHHNKNGVAWAGFDYQEQAEKFAEKVNGTVKFSPLPGYMGMTPYWVVTWKE